LRGIELLINERHAEFAISLDPRPAEAGDTILIFRNHEILLRSAAETDRLPLWGEVAGAFGDVLPRHAFGQGERRFFLLDAEADASAPPGFAFEGIRVFRTLRPALDGALLSVGYHLAIWYRNHRFCGACGDKLRMAAAERALVCERCGLTIFPSISPAVIVAVTDGPRLLLALGAHSTWKHFSLIAGYVEAGETAGQAVRREVLEEVGLRIKNVRYIKSQPWGFSQSLMLGFTAELDGPDVITLQESELSEAHWFARGEVPQMDNHASIASDLMDLFRSGRIGGQD